MEGGTVNAGLPAGAVMETSCLWGQKFRDKRDHSGDYQHVRNTDAQNTNKEHYVALPYFRGSEHVWASDSLSQPLDTFSWLCFFLPVCRWIPPLSCLMKHLSFWSPRFHSGPCCSIRWVHSVLFHFLMTVQPVSRNELTHVLLVRRSFRQMYCMAASDFQARATRAVC